MGPTFINKFITAVFKPVHQEIDINAVAMEAPKIQAVRNMLDNGKFRNHPCPCGSGRKSKKCCGKERYVTPEGHVYILKNLQRQGREIGEELARIK